MTIDIKNFDYVPIRFDQNKPELIEQTASNENSSITFDFKYRELDKGFELTVLSDIKIPLHHTNNTLSFQGSSTFLIPSEQHIDRQKDRLNEINNTVYLEFLYQHLSRQTAIIYSETYNNYPETKGYIVKIPSLFDLNQTSLYN